MSDGHKREPEKETRRLDQDKDDASPLVRPDTESLDVTPWVLEFRVVGTPNIIRAPAKEMVTMGRSDANSPSKPDIDLSEHNAQYQGVSRRHARLLIRDNRVAIQDLGSVNGTFINGHVLKPEQIYRLRDADQLRLGLLELQVHFVVQPSVNEDTFAGLENAMQIPTLASGERLLIVDDNPNVCQIIEHVARRAGFEVHVVHGAVDAIKYLGDNVIDLMILELVLPDANGMDVVNYLRNQHDRPVPILGITAATAGFRMRQAREQGVNITLGKPLAVDELTQALGTLMGILSES